MAKRVEISEADARKLIRLLDETRPEMLKTRDTKKYNLWREAHKLSARIQRKLIE